jgi:hypothetical protein
MNRFLRAFASFFLLATVTVSVFPQDESPVKLGADFMSRYIWRGLNLGGSSPSIQPWITYSLSAEDSPHALTIGAWGAYTFSQTSNQEVDLYLTYSFKDVISLSVTDYFFPGLFSGGERSRYFNYDRDSTCHVFEGIFSFNGTEKIPFTFLFGMNFYGNDARRINSDDSPGRIFMTKYVELGYNRSIGDVDLNVFAGAALDKPDTDRGESGFYGNSSPGIINLGIKAARSIQITEKYAVPIQASIITNPESENIYMVFGISF